MPSTIYTVGLDDPIYPRRLYDLSTPPPRLRVRGPLPLAQRSVAIVGARAASAHAMARARSMAEELARRDVVVVSGGALGIDGAAHRGASVAGGVTLAVMGCGVDTFYPRRHRSLFESVLATGGCLLSPFEDGARPRRWHFVSRNRLIAALADLVVVVQAEMRSGSLHTARFAHGLGRRLAVCPGSAACDALIARGVTPVRDAAELVRILDGEALPGPAPLHEIDGRALRVLDAAMRLGPSTASELARAAGLDPRGAARVALGLELRGLLLADPAGRYRPSTLARQQRAGDSGAAGRGPAIPSASSSCGPNPTSSS
jgi:DNA processing protein